MDLTQDAAVLSVAHLQKMTNVKGLKCRIATILLPFISFGIQLTTSYLPRAARECEERRGGKCIFMSHILFRHVDGLIL